jgi:hypothetical protein
MATRTFTFPITAATPSATDLENAFTDMPNTPSYAWTGGGYARLWDVNGWISEWSYCSWPSGPNNGEWVTGLVRGFYDPVQKRIVHFTGSHDQTGSRPGLQQMLQYDLAEGEWSQSYLGQAAGVAVFDMHAWDQTVYDPALRRLIAILHINTTLRACSIDAPFPASCSQDGDNTVLPSDLGEAWTQVGTYTVSNTNHNAMAWHPNLFGPGNGGIVGFSNRVVRAWNPNTNVWSVVTGPANEVRFRETLGVGECTAVYSPNLDMVVGGFGEITNPVPGDIGENVRVFWNGSAVKFAWNQALPPSTMWGSIPVSATQAIGHRLHLHPNNTDLLILESAGNSARTDARVMKLNTTTWQWELQSYFHPFLASTTWGAKQDRSKDWAVVTIPGFGMHALRATTSTMSGNDIPKAILWRLP